MPKHPQRTQGAPPVPPQPAASEPQQTSFLSTFKLVPVEKGATSKPDPLHTARENLVKEIRKQQEAVRLEISGQALPTKSFKVNGKDRTRQFSKWYFTREGTVFSQVRYGQRSLFKEGEKAAALQVGKELKDLLVFYGGLIAAVEKGELDAMLTPLTARKKP